MGGSNSNPINGISFVSAWQNQTICIVHHWIFNKPFILPFHRCDCPERPCRHSAAGGGTRHRVSVQPSSPTFSQASQSNQQQQQPCECAERINCTHTGGGECECGEEAKPCSHTVRQRRSRRTCDCSGSGSQPCSHKPQHEGRIKRVKCRVRRAGCAMARCTAELAMLHLHWGLATECAPCRPRALTRRLCRRQQSDNELYRSNSFKFERFERSKDECATPLRKQVSTLWLSLIRPIYWLAEIIYRIFYLSR